MTSSLKRGTEANQLRKLDIGAGTQGLGNINVDVRRLSHIEVVCTGTHLPFGGSVFDAVYLRDVIEHLRYGDVQLVLEEVRRVMKPEGLLELWTPNFQSISLAIVWLFGVSRDPRRRSLYPPLTGDQDYPENVHLSQWSMKLLEDYLHSAGLRVVIAETVGDYRGRLRPVGLLIRILRNRGGIIHLVARRERGSSGFVGERRKALSLSRNEDLSNSQKVSQ